MIVGLFIMLVFFNSQNFINGIKENDNLFLPNFYIFSPLHLQFHILGFYWHNLRTINEATLSNNQILKFLFLIYDFGKFPLTAEFNYSFVSFSPMAILDVVWVSDYISITQN